MPSKKYTPSPTEAKVAWFMLVFLFGLSLLAAFGDDIYAKFLPTVGVASCVIVGLIIVRLYSSAQNYRALYMGADVQHDLLLDTIENLRMVLNGAVATLRAHRPSDHVLLVVLRRDGESDAITLPGEQMHHSGHSYVFVPVVEGTHLVLTVHRSAAPSEGVPMRYEVRIPIFDEDNVIYVWTVDEHTMDTVPSWLGGNVLAEAVHRTRWLVQ